MSNSWTTIPKPRKCVESSIGSESPEKLIGLLGGCRGVSVGVSQLIDGFFKQRRAEGRIIKAGFLAINDRYFQFHTAEARLTRGWLNVVAVGRKCLLKLVNIPLNGESFMSLLGKTSVLTCESYLRSPTTYGYCYTTLLSDFFFPDLRVHFEGFDEDGQTLAVAFDGGLLQAYWEVADMLPGRRSTSRGLDGFDAVRLRKHEQRTDSSYLLLVYMSQRKP